MLHWPDVLNLRFYCSLKHSKGSQKFRGPLFLYSLIFYNHTRLSGNLDGDNVIDGVTSWTIYIKTKPDEGRCNKKPQGLTKLLFKPNRYWGRYSHWGLYCNIGPGTRWETFMTTEECWIKMLILFLDGSLEEWLFDVQKRSVRRFIVRQS